MVFERIFGPSGTANSRRYRDWDNDGYYDDDDRDRQDTFDIDLFDPEEDGPFE